MAFGHGVKSENLCQINECRLNKLFLKAYKESFFGGWCYPVIREVQISLLIPLPLP